MDLKQFFAQKENPPEIYWSLIIEPGNVQAGAWYIDGGSAKVVASGPSVAWEEQESLLGAVDATLSSVIQKLPEEFPEPTKTVFGVSSAWTTSGEIKQEHLPLIKKICTDLSLTPTGFVVLPEAIAHLLKSEEGTPVNAVIIGLGSENLEVSVFRLGNLIGTFEVARSVSLVEDTIEGLSRFDSPEPFPSRFVVFDGKEGDLEEAKNSLSEASWEENEKVKFLHPPKIEVLAPERKVLAISLAGAAELGEASKVESQEEEQELKNIEEPKNPPTATEMGFVVGGDVTATNKVEEPQPNFPEPKAEVPTGPSTLEKTRTIFHSFIGKVSSGIMEAPKMMKGKRLVLTLSILTVFLICLGLIWWFVPKATVSIYVEPKKFEKSFEVSFNTQGKFDVGGGLIPGSVAEAEVSGEKTKSTTGTKLIGDRAKGTVKIGNSSSSDILLKSGTSLASSGDLVFTTNSEASISAAIDSFTPGVATVGVTAGDIGAQYNLGNGEIFKVSNYLKSEVSAVSTADFSGGSSREISAVAKDDQEELQVSLEEELKREATIQLGEKATSGQILAGDFISFEPGDVSFDHKIGDEADTIKLNLTMIAKGIVADKEKLNSFVQEKLKGETPEGFVLRDSQISYKFSFREEVDGIFIFDVDASVNFLPKVDEGVIIKNILGRTPAAVQSYLTSIPGYKKAKVFIKPHFPGIFGSLPRVAKNISIEIVAQ